MIAICDVNNFYASCERAFNPAIWHKPVIVLSNNDGCAVARSNQVKKLGIKTGDPVFKIKHLIAKHKIQVFSSNYVLYGDMSHRVDDIIAQYSDQVENYSIDESFLKFDGFEHLDLTRHCQKMVGRIWQWLSLPVCVGLASTKTLAKVAGYYAKKMKIEGGVLELATESRIEKALRNLPVEKIWGVGGRTKEHLNSMGIYSALQLRNTDPKFMRKRFSVVMERTIMELRGISCVAFDADPEKKKQIVCSRSFGRKIQELKPLQEAVAYHITRACVTLRAQGSVAKSINVGLTTSHKNIQYQQHTHSVTIGLPQASDFTADFLQAATQGLGKLFKPGNQYKKAGIMLNDFSDAQNIQLDLFTQTSERQNQQNKDLMNTLDSINTKFGKGTLRSAQEGFSQQWAMRANTKSPEYTTNWNQLISVR